MEISDFELIPITKAAIINTLNSVSRKKRHEWRWVLFLLPALGFYLFVVLIPSFKGVESSFTNWSGLSRTKEWVGLAQFKKVFSDSDSIGALKHTFYMAVGITVIQNFIGLLLALGVHSKIKSKNILRVLFFAPAVIAPVATAYLWQYVFAPDGPLNTALNGVGAGGLIQDWLGDPHIVLRSIITVVVWQFAGYSMVIYLAGLESVPQELLEASELDGANYIQKFWYVVRPFLYPAITVTLMLSIIGGMKLFDQVAILTGGGPAQSSQTISTLIYRDAFSLGEFAYSAAMAVVLTIIVGFVSGIQYFALSRTEKS